MFLLSNALFAAAGGFTVIAFSSLMLCRPPASSPATPLATPPVCFVLQGPLFYDCLFMILILASFLQVPSLPAAPSFPSLLQSSGVTSVITAGRKDTAGEGTKRQSTLNVATFSIYNTKVTWCESQ